MKFVLYIVKFWCADKIPPLYIVCVTNVTKSFTNDTYRESSPAVTLRTSIDVIKERVAHYLRV